MPARACQLTASSSLVGSCRPVTNASVEAYRRSVSGMPAQAAAARAAVIPGTMR